MIFRLGKISVLIRKRGLVICFACGTLSVQKFYENFLRGAPKKLDGKRRRGRSPSLFTPGQICVFTCVELLTGRVD